MSKWKLSKLKDVTITTNTGLDAIKRAPIVERNTGVKCLRIQDISQSKPIEKWGNTEVTDENKEKFRLRKGEIIMARTCSTGINYFVKEDLPAVFNNGLVRIRANIEIVDPKFLYYVFKTKEFIGHIDGISGSTSVQLNMQVGDLLSYEFLVPTLSVQKSIAEVLSSLDEKIDLLQRNNNTLGQIAETLFREYFIENNGKQEIHKLKDYVVSANTGLDAIRSAPIVEIETGVKCLRIQDVSQQKTYLKWGNSEVEEHKFSKFQLRKNDIIMARTCSPGINYFVREDLQAVFNNGLVRIRANENKVHPIFLYQLFKTKEFIGHIDGISGSTSVQLNMQVGDLLSYEFTFIDKSKQDLLVDKFLAIDEKIYLNLKQIQQITTLRDTLLSKLMSEQVFVQN